MLITEIFQSSAKWIATIEEADEFKAIFKIGLIRYEFYAYVDADSGIWDMWFSSKTGNDKPRFDITGSGSSVLVMSTIIDIMRTFISKYKPTTLHFSAAEPSRLKLYSRLINTLLPTWYKHIGGVDNHYVEDTEIYVSKEPIYDE